MYGPDETYMIFCRSEQISDEGEEVWILTGKYTLAELDEALKHYAIQLKEYGMRNVMFNEVLRPTCISIEVLYEGKTVNSQ